MMTFGQAMKLGATVTTPSTFQYLYDDKACAIGAAIYAAGYRNHSSCGFFKQDCVQVIHEKWPYTIDARANNGVHLLAVAEYMFMSGGKTRDQVAEWVMQWERDHGILVDELQPAVVEEEEVLV